MEPYGKTFALTDAIIQGARTCSRLELFGIPEKNVMYAEAIRSKLRTNGHIVEIKFTTRRETLKNIERIVIAEELLCRKHNDNSILNAVERKVFWNNKPIGAAPRWHLFWGGRGPFGKKGVTLRRLRISEKKAILRKPTAL